MKYSKNFISELDDMIEASIGEYIPQEFITAAKVTEINGRTYMINKQELNEIMSSQSNPNIAKIKFAIELKDVRKVILELSEQLVPNK